MSFIRYLKQRLQQILPTGSLRERFAIGTFWSITGTALAQIFGLLSSIVVARLLGKTGFGELGMVISTATMFAVFAGMGLGLTATKYVAEYRVKDPECAGRILGVSSAVAMISGSIISAIIFFMSPYMAVHTINAPFMVHELQIASFMLLFGALNGAQIGALSGFEAFKTIAKVNLFTAILSFILRTIGTYFWGIRGAVSGQVAAIGVGWLICHIALRIETRKFNIPVTYRHISRELQVLYKFSLPAVLSSSLLGPVMWIANAMLANQPNGYAELGIFTAANQWKTAILLIPVLVGNVVTPIMSNILGAGEKSAAKRMLLFTILINSIAVSIPSLILSVLSPWVMAQYGQGFREGWLILVVCLLPAILLAIINPVGNVIAASGKMWIGFTMNLGWSIGFLFFVKLFLAWGALGMAFAYLIAYLLHTIWSFGYAYFVILKT